MRTSLVCNEKFDIEFADNGVIATIEDAPSVANMLYLDFNSNADWILDKDLGLNWINTDNSGLLQIKNPEVLIVGEIQRKLEALDGIKEVTEIEINKTLKNSLYVVVKATAFDGTEFELRNEVV